MLTLFSFAGIVDTAINRCLIAVATTAVWFKPLAMVGEICGRATNKECWRTQYHTWGAEAVMACITATHHWIITPTITFQGRSTCSWQCFCVLLSLQSLLLLFSISNITFLLIPLYLNIITSKFTVPEKSCSLLRQGLYYHFIVVNGNLCLKFFGVVFKFCCIY